MELPYDYCMPDDDEDRVCYVMLCRRGGCCNAGRHPTRRCPMLSPDMKPSLLVHQDVSDDLWLVPFHRFILRRDRVQKQYTFFVQVWAHFVSWWCIAGGIYAVLPPRGGGILLEEEAISKKVTFVHIVAWLGCGVVIFAIAALWFRYLNQKQKYLERQLVRSMKPKYLALGYEMEYHAVSKPCCGTCFQKYSYSYLRIERHGSALVRSDSNSNEYGIAEEDNFPNALV
jgi:hypothetical protein